jgi:HK97 family phage prohead protease
MYDMFGPYEETIRAGSFDQSLKRSDLDVAFLVNHRGVTMARTTTGTLELDANPDLHSVAYLNPNREDVRTIISAIDDGLVDEMSFAFYLNAGGWNEDYDKFTIYEADIHRGDVSAVNYGANPYTSIAVRATEILGELDRLPAGAQRAALSKLLAVRGTPTRALTGPDADESPTLMIQSLDALLDQAVALFAGVDAASLPAEIGQGIAVVNGAEALVDLVMDLLGIYDADDNDADDRSSSRARAHRSHTTTVNTGNVEVLASSYVPMTVDGSTLDDERAPHGAVDGSHTHSHPAYGDQGGDETHSHEHSHSGDDNHDHHGGGMSEYAAGKTSDAEPAGMATEMLAQFFEMDEERDR